VSEATWLALATVLTLLGLGWTFFALRRRGAVSATRALGVTLLVPAAYLTGTLELAGDIAVDVADWARGLVFSPVVWTGVGIFGLAVVLIVVSGFLRSRGVGQAHRTRDTRAAEAGRRPAGEVGAPSAGRGEPVLDDDLADIEAILKRRGIS